MTYARILIPVALGVVAFVLNYFALSQRSATQELVVMKDTLRAGEEIKLEMLRPLEVTTAGQSTITKSAVPFGQRGAALVGRKVRRTIDAGEIVFFDDVSREDAGVAFYALEPNEIGLQVAVSQARVSTALIRIGAQVGFVIDARGKDDAPPADMKILGPFRVLAVGEQTDPRLALRVGTRDTSTLTVAVPRKDTLEAKYATLVRVAAGEGGDRIAAVVLYPPGDRAAKKP